MAGPVQRTTSAPLLDILYREYPPLAPTNGKLQPAEVPVHLLEGLEPLQQMLRSALERLPSSVTTWGVSSGHRGVTTLSLQWITGIAPEPLPPQHLLVDETRRSSEVIYSIGDRAAGVRLDFTSEEGRLSHRISVLYRHPDRGGPVRRYESAAEDWVLVDVLQPFTDDVDAATAELRLAPVFDQLEWDSFPDSVTEAMRYAKSAAPLHSTDGVGIATVGLNMEECVAVLSATMAGRSLAHAIEGARHRLDHREFDVVQRYSFRHPSDAEEVSVWGVA